MDWSRRRNWKRKLPVMAAMALCIFAAAGCGRRTKQNDRTGEGFCGSSSVFDCLEGQSFCDKGMLKLESGLMIFYEYDTGKSYPLCSDVYCEHKPYHETKNPDPVCEATMKEIKQACIYGDHVYVIQETGFQQMALKVRNLTESGYKSIAELPYKLPFSAAYNAIIDGKMYLLVSDTDVELGDGPAQIFTSHDFYTSLLEIDLKTGEYKKLFEFEGKEKYKVYKTVYGTDGVYLQGYFEDVNLDEESLHLTVNEYRDEFFFVSYDGKVRKKLCPEVTELTEFGGDRPCKALVNGIDEKGVYVSLLEENKVVYYPYKDRIQTIYEVPKEAASWSVAGMSGTALCLDMENADGKEEKIGIERISKKVTSMEKFDGKFFHEVYDGCFWVDQRIENEMIYELWTYDKMCSENGSPLLSRKIEIEE